MSPDVSARIEPLEPRSLMASGVVDTSLPYYFQTSDVPAIADWIGDRAAHTPQVRGYVAGGNAYLDERAAGRGYVPAASDRHADWTKLALAYRYLSAEGTAAFHDARPAREYADELVRQ